MARELMFRAWDGKEMYQVVNLDLTQNYCCHAVNVDGQLKYIRYEQIMQLTGLKDKNGQEIYEGDILDFDPDEFGAELREPIWMDALIKGDYFGALSDFARWRQVIGNIYENPDLIK